jgi:hypothetical protein
MSSNFLRITVAIWTGAIMLSVQSCGQTIIQPTSFIPSPSHVSPTLDNSTQVSPVTPTLFVETPQCAKTTIPPRIANIQPSPIRPGSEITITGTGGYIQDSCGGINESARTFSLYLDNESVGDLLCYVNHCEVRFYLADTITSGLHCLSTQKDICEFEFQVMSK